MDASIAEDQQVEAQSERVNAHPIVEHAKQAFDAAQKEVAPKSVYDAHQEAFQKIVSQIPEDQRGSLRVRAADVWNKAVGRVDDVSARVLDFAKDNSPFELAYRFVGKLRGVDVPTGQIQAMREAQIRGASEVQTEMMKQQIDRSNTFKDIIPGGKVLNIVDRILGPRFGRI